jgi:uncharacterized protein (TIGR00730 family)
MKDKNNNSRHQLERLLKHSNRLWSDFMQATRAYGETLHAFMRFSSKKRCITVFGSARFKPEDRYYQIAEKLGGMLAKADFSVMTGGGPGIMQAVNKGVHDANGKSFGASISLPNEQGANPYLHHKKNFKYFFTRKLILTKYSDAFIIMPGGFGTLDELFEVATLIDTKRIARCPLVIIGKEYWLPLFDFLRYQMTAYHTISQESLELFYLTDDLEDAINHIKQNLASVGK